MCGITTIIMILVCGGSRSVGLHEVCLVLLAEGRAPVLEYGEVFVAHVEYLVKKLGQSVRQRGGKFIRQLQKEGRESRGHPLYQDIIIYCAMCEVVVCEGG